MDMFSVTEMSDKDLSFLDNIDCNLVNSDEVLNKARERLGDKDVLVLDTETEGLSPFHHVIVGVILAPSEEESYYFPLRHKVGTNLDEAKFIVFFKELCKRASFILANAKFDWKMIFHHWNIDFEIKADVIQQAYILDSDLAESGKLNLKALSREYLHIEPLELSDYGETNFSLFDPEEAYKYACPDGTSPWALYKIFSKKIQEFNLRKVELLELSIIKAVGTIELTGIKVDTQVLKDQQERMLKRVEYLENKIHRLAGVPFDVASPKQMAEILYDVLKIPPVKKNGNEDRSVGAANLDALQGKHPIIKAIKNYREVSKLYNDFILKLPECLAEDGRLHGELNSTGTRSGRFSASGGFGKGGLPVKVNVQQLPKSKGFEDEVMIRVNPEVEQKFDFSRSYDIQEVQEVYPNWKEDQKQASSEWKLLTMTVTIPVKVRDALVPSDGYVWVSIDFSRQLGA